MQKRNDWPITAVHPPSTQGPGLQTAELEAPPWIWDGSYDQLKHGITRFLEDRAGPDGLVRLHYEELTKDANEVLTLEERHVLIPSAIVERNQDRFLAPCIPCHSRSSFNTVERSVEVWNFDGCVVACTKAGCAPAAILASFGAAFDGIGAQSLSYSDLQAIESVPELVRGYIDERALVATPGKYGGLKTFATTVNLAASLATGMDWFGLEVPRSVPVLVLATEGVGTLPERLAGWVEHYEPDMGLLDGNLHVRGEAFDLRNDRKVAELERAVDNLGVRYVLIDTLAKAIPGADENSGSDMGPVIEALTHIRDTTGATVHSITHTGLQADGRSRGWSGFDDAQDIILPIFGKWESETKKPVTLRSIKQRSRANPDPIAIGLRETPNGLPCAVRVEVTIDNELLTLIASHGGEGVLQPDLVKEVSGMFPRKTVQKALDRLEGDGRVLAEVQQQLRGRPRLLRVE